MPRRLKSWLRRGLIYSLAAIVGLTTRKVLVNWNVLESHQREGKPHLLGFWHNHILFLIHLLARYRYPSMVSFSRDGEDIAWVIERFGFEPVRGSQGTKGSIALRQSLRHLSESRPVIITPDGPRGPRHVVKPGIAALSRKKGVPVIPLCMFAPRRWEFGSWDRMQVPKPFSKVVVLVGYPLRLDDAEDDEAGRLRVERALHDLMAIAERFATAAFPGATPAGGQEGEAE